MNMLGVALPTPDGLQIALTVVTLALGAIAIAKVFIPFARWLTATGGRFMGAIDNLAGRDPRIDRATGKTIEGIPAIGDRFAGIEKRLDRVANVNDRLDRVRGRLLVTDAVEARVDVVEATQAALIGGTFERGSKDLLSAVEKQNAGVIDVDPA